MRYVLGIGFNYKKYKKNAIVKVWMDDVLIEDYLLEKDIGNVSLTHDQVLEALDPIGHEDSNSAYWDDMLKSTPGSKIVTRLTSRVKLFELDGEHIGKTLTVQIDNNDSNYTNGFMSKSSVVIPKTMFLCPKYLLEGRGEKLIKLSKRIQKKHRMYVHRNPHLATWNTTVDSYDNKNTDEYICHKDDRLPWPMLDKLDIEEGDGDYDDSRYHWWNAEIQIGGKLLFHAKITKTKGIHVIHNNKNKLKGMPKIPTGMLLFARLFDNKYIHED